MMNVGPAAIAALGVSLALFTPVPAFASGGPDTPPQESVSFKLLRSTGSGCQAGTVEVLGDLGSFALTYENYSAQAGGTSLPTDDRKDCQVVLEVTAPSEFTYAISRAEHRGFADLQRGASGILKSSYHYGGLRHHEDYEVSGPRSGGVHFDSSAPELDYKPCGEKHDIDIGTELRVNLGTSDESKISYLMLDGPNTKNSIYHLEWKGCS